MEKIGHRKINDWLDTDLKTHNGGLLLKNKYIHSHCAS